MTPIGPTRAPLRGGRTALAILTVGLLTLTPGSAPAGTQDDPEITDACEEFGADALRPHDICSAWWRGLWRAVPREDDPTRTTWAFDGLETTLRVAGGLPSQPPPHEYLQLAWTVGGCTQYWILDSAAATFGAPLRWILVYREVCGQPPLYERSVFVDESNGRVKVEPDRVTVRLTADGLLGSTAERLVEGEELVSLLAASYLKFGYGGNNIGVRADLGQTDRTFVIGQDRPPDPGEP